MKSYLKNSKRNNLTLKDFFDQDLVTDELEEEEFVKLETPEPEYSEAEEKNLEISEEKSLKKEQNFEKSEKSKEKSEEKFENEENLLINELNPETPKSTFDPSHIKESFKKLIFIESCITSFFMKKTIFFEV